MQTTPYRLSTGLLTDDGGIFNDICYDIPITRAVSEAVSIPVVASGGAGNPDHLGEAIRDGKADAALAASIFHFGTYTISETKQRMREMGIAVRLPSASA